MYLTLLDVDSLSHRDKNTQDSTTNKIEMKTKENDNENSPMHFYGQTKNCKNTALHPICQMVFVSQSNRILSASISNGPNIQVFGWIFH